MNLKTNSLITTANVCAREISTFFHDMEIVLLTRTKEIYYDYLLPRFVRVASRVIALINVGLAKQTQRIVKLSPTRIRRDLDLAKWQ